MPNPDLHPADLELLANTELGVLITLKRDGRPQSSNINYAFDPEREIVRISSTAVTMKVKNMQRDPRANLHVMRPDGWSWMVAEANVVLSPVAKERDDATVEELIDVFRAIQGEHPDWDDYRRAMVEDQRLVVRLELIRTYGSAAR